MKKIILIASVVFISLMFCTYLIIDRLTEAKNNLLITISTSRLTRVETNGRKFENDPIFIDGVSLKYFIIINNPNNQQIELPSEKEVKYGPEKNIKAVYFYLKGNQGTDTAELPFRFK